MTLDEIFGPDGLFARKFPGYSPRSEQVRLARAWEHACAKGEIMIGEGPCGIGKSIAALVPAILDLKKNGGKLVYATANIALQEQLVRKDLPLLKELLPIEFTFALAKGFGNYVCKDRMDETETERMMGKFRGDPDLDFIREVLVFQWTKGDVSEFPKELGAKKHLFTISSEECIGKRCAHFDSCYPRAAKREFGSVDVIVTNYHLYFIDLAMKLGGARGVLPPHRLLVLDEFHRVPEIARQYFGTRVSRGGVKTVTAELDAKGRRADKLEIPKAAAPALRQEIERLSDRYFSELDQIRKSKEYRARFTRPRMIDGEDLEAKLLEASKTYAEMATGPALPSEARDFLISRSEGCSERALAIRQARLLDRPDWIAYAEGDQKIELAVEPVDAGKFLKRALWKDRASRLDAPRAIACISATLATGSGDDAFEFVCRKAGIDDDVEGVVEILCDSPFDFSRCALVVPRKMPEPNDPTFVDAVGERLVELCFALDGDVLGLFTSYRVMKACAERLRAVFSKPVLVQGEQPRSLLVQRFREERGTVLLGTDSLWEGVDVPGDHCSAVLIDRIPFAHFDDPVIDAIKERDPKGWFKNHYVPEAVIAFKQGFGRLIRTKNDVGVVMLCDSRVWTKGYGSKFRRAVPSETVIREKTDDVGELVAAFRARRVA